jgi:hypothetical protein
MIRTAVKWTIDLLLILSRIASVIRPATSNGGTIGASEDVLIRAEIIEGSLVSSRHQKLSRLRGIPHDESCQFPCLSKCSHTIPETDCCERCRVTVMVICYRNCLLEV